MAVQPLPGQLLYADVHGIPNTVLCLVLYMCELWGLPKVLVVVQGWHIHTYATRISKNLTVYYQQQQAARIIGHKYKGYVIRRRARDVLAPAVMHWGCKPGGPLQRLLAQKAQASFGQLNIYQ